MLTFLTFSWEFSTGKFFIYWSVLLKFQESVTYYLVITLWKCEYCLTCVLNKSILFDSNSLKVSVLLKLCSIVCQLLSENISFVWCLEKCVVLFGSNSIKVSVLFDMESETCLVLLVGIVWKCEYFFIFWPNTFYFVTACFRFSCMYFWPLGWLWLKDNLVYIWFFKAFPCNSSLPDFRLKRAGQLNG